MVKRVVGVVAGMLAGVVVIFLVEGISSYFYPPPPGLDMSDAAAMKAFVAGLPTGAFLFVLAAHALGAFAAGATCALIVRQVWLIGSLMVGGLFLAAGIANLMLIPHPTWVAVVDVLIYLPAALAGGAVGGRLLPPRPAAPPTA